MAVKTITKTGNGQVLMEFLEEANVVSTLKHPNIIKMFGINLSPPRLVCGCRMLSYANLVH